MTLYDIFLHYSLGLYLFFVCILWAFAFVTLYKQITRDRSIVFNFIIFVVFIFASIAIPLICPIFMAKNMISDISRGLPFEEVCNEKNKT
jgi:hypothetical protein